MWNRCKMLGSVAGTALATCFFLSVPSVDAAVNVVNSEKSAELVKSENADGSVKFSLGLGAAYLTGESHELVYWPEYNNHKASELTWKIDSLYMANINATLDIYNDWFIHFDGWFKVTDGDGAMDDYDWMNVGGDWTDWSHHDDTDVTSASMIDISGGWKAVNKERFTLSGLVGYKRDVFGWESYGGSYIYSESGFRDSSGNFADGALGISYEQTFSSIYVGLGAEFTLSDMISLSGRAIYSPIVQAEADDHHYESNFVTYDDFSGGDMFGFDVSVIINISKSLALDVGYSYLNYDEMQGDSDWDYGYGIYTAADGAGADHNSSWFSVGLRYSF